MRTPKSFLVGLSLIALAVAAATSCADQAAGERCDLRNGNGDCESGLECVAASQLASLRDLKGEKNVGLCCPPESTASEPSCDRGTGLPDFPDAGDDERDTGAGQPDATPAEASTTGG